MKNLILLMVAGSLMCSCAGSKNLQKSSNQTVKQDSFSKKKIQFIPDLYSAGQAIKSYAVTYSGKSGAVVDGVVGVVTILFSSLKFQKKEQPVIEQPKYNVASDPVYPQD